MELVLRLIGAGVTGTLLCVILRPHRQDMAVILSILCGVMLLTVCCTMAQPVVDTLQDMMQQAGMDSQYFVILMKAVGITYLTQFACDICCDAGEKAVGAKIELAGRFAVLLLAMPLYVAVFRTIEELLQ